MASNCFTPIRGRRIRVTLVDTLGRPRPGECSVVSTGGFVNVEMAAEIEEGEETTVRTAGGELCVSEKGADQLKWINVSIEFCQVDPDLFSMINPTWTKLLDHLGQTIGWEESHEYSVDAGFGLEVWSDVTGYTPSDPNAAGAWVYYLLPFVVGGTLGDITVENGAVSFTITGRTKKGSQWGKGPFDVMANAPDGVCGPLITPFNPESPRRVFLTTCRPPDSTCGCVPLSAPDGPNATVVEATSDATRFSIRAYASGAGPFSIDWGDGSSVEDLTPGLTGEVHQYGTAGTYNVKVYPTGVPSRMTYNRVTLPFTGATPELPLVISVTEVTSDANRRTARIDWNNGTAGTVKVDWGDGTVVVGQTQSGNLNHAYASGAASYTARVVDETDAGRQESEIITIPFGPVLTLAEDVTDADSRTVIATVNNWGKGAVSINWGQVGAPTPINAGNGTAESTYKYTAGGTYTVVVTDTDDPTRTTTKNVTVPFP